MGSVYYVLGIAAEAARDGGLVATAHRINLALYQYATDHDGKFPEGKTSTEIFQQLIDQKFVDDPAIFYVPMKGKSMPVGTRLKPENVCWDFTNKIPNGAEGGDSSTLPMVFLTGYRIHYVPGGDAVPLSGAAGTALPISIFPVGCFDGSASADKPQADGVVHGFIPANFDPQGRTYEQLTPDGPLPVSP
jgi:hypothetical protein